MSLAPLLHVSGDAHCLIHLFMSYVYTWAHTHTLYSNLKCLSLYYSLKFHLKYAQKWSKTCVYVFAFPFHFCWTSRSYLDWHWCHSWRQEASNSNSEQSQVYWKRRPKPFVSGTEDVGSNFCARSRCPSWLLSLGGLCPFQRLSVYFCLFNRWSQMKNRLCRMSRNENLRIV